MRILTTLFIIVGTVLCVISCARPGGKVSASTAPRGAVRHQKISVRAPFAMPAIDVPIFPDRAFTITDFGAQSRDTFNNAQAIARAIAACSDAGGGRVVIPAGQWMTGAVHLKSNVNLHLEKDAVLLFSPDPADYLPAVQSSWEGMECFNYSPLIYAFECENVAVTGPGTLRAQMDTWEKWFARPPAHMEALKQLYTMASTNVPVEQRRMAEGENHLRPQFIQFNRCRNVLLEDFKIRNSPFWTVHLFMCESAVVRRLDISARGHNNDGIDPEMTRNLLVEDCKFDQGDDAIAIKAGRNQDAWRLNQPTENVVIRNCDVIRGHELVAIGSELSGGVRNVFVQNCRFDAQTEPFNLLYIKTNRRRGGVVENIYMENVRAGKVQFSVLGIETDVLYQWRNLVPTYEERITTIRNIHVKDVHAGETTTPFLIVGDEQRPVKDVFIDNVTIDTVRGKRQIYENAENVKESSITIKNFIDTEQKVNKNK